MNNTTEYKNGARNRYRLRLRVAEGVKTAVRPPCI